MFFSILLVQRMNPLKEHLKPSIKKHDQNNPTLKDYYWNANAMFGFCKILSK